MDQNKIEELKALLEINNLVKEMKAELTIIVYPWPGQIYRNDYNIKQASIWKEWTSWQ